MDGSTKWLRSIVAAIKSYQHSGSRTLDDLAAQLSSLAWSDSTPTAQMLGGAADRFLRRPITGANNLGCSALLMYWPAGHATLPHDHGGFWGIEVVLDGTLHVEEFVLGGSADAPTLAKTRCVYLGVGDVAVFDSARYVHRCRNLSNTGPTLTLNVYGGPLERYVAFEGEASGILRAQPTSASSDVPVD